MVTLAAIPHQRTELSSGALEAAKWVALVAMVVDHVDAVFFGRSLGVVAEFVGRLAMPLFSLVLAYNLARPGIDLDRLAWKLAGFGLLATPWFAGLFGGAVWWMPLNILFTFAAAALVLRALDRGQWWWAVLVFLLSGVLVEYAWPGIFFVVAARQRFLAPKGETLVFFVLALAGLCWWNGNLWALAAVPLLHGLNAWSPVVLRLRWAFWAFYPAHLAAFWVVTALGV